MEGRKEALFFCPGWTDFPDIELYMDQVISVLERYLAPFFPEEEKCITSTMINNYVKQRILPPPQNKKYARCHLARLFMICILKRFLQLSDISLLLDRLENEAGQEGAFDIFQKALDSSLVNFFKEGKKTIPDGKTGTERVISSCTDAFAAILFSRSVFLAAGFSPKESEEEKEIYSND